MPAKGLTGESLLIEVDRCNKEGMSRRKVMVACGYVTKSQDGRSYTRASEFYEALLAAQGISVGAEAPKGVRRLSFQAQVQSNGAVTIAKGYTQRLGLAPGRLLSIELCPEDQSFRLRCLSEQEEPAGSAAA